MTLVGTIRKNKREIPALFEDVKNREKNTAIFGFHDKMTLMLSSCPNKKKKKTVLMLLTTHDLRNKDEDVTRPEIVEFYNKNKGGGDVFDRLCKNYSVVRHTKRLTAAVFGGLLNASGVNIFVLMEKQRERGN